MVTICHLRATPDEPDVTIFEAPRDDKTLTGIAAGKFELGSTVITDEYRVYYGLEMAGYDHRTINHAEGEYASGGRNEIHASNCQCRVALFNWWLKKHRASASGTRGRTPSRSSLCTTAAIIASTAGLWLR